MAAISLKNSQQIVDLIIFWSEIAGSFQSLRGQVVVSLAQCEHSPIRPSRGFRGYELGQLRKLALGVNVIANLERCQSNIERRNNIGIGLRSFLRQLRGRVTPGQERYKASEEQRRRHALKIACSPVAQSRSSAATSDRVDAH